MGAGLWKWRIQACRRSDRNESNKYSGEFYRATEFCVLIILSGPEPQRSILEKLLVRKYLKSSEKIILIRGTKEQLSVRTGTIEIHNVLYGEALRNKILNAEKIICRSGYSTLMDLHVLGKKQLLLIPTPGQTEQEYLAEYWRLKFGAEILPQAELEHSHH